MTVAKSIPLTATDDGAQGMVLKQEDTTGGDPAHPLGQRLRLVGRVHQAEAIYNNFCRLARPHRREPPVAQQP